MNEKIKEFLQREFDSDETVMVFVNRQQKVD